MAKDKLTDYDSTAANNLDVGGISVAEGMLPSGVNNAIREQMSHLADFAAGTSGVDVLKLQDDTDTNSIKLQAPSSVTTTTTFTLPDGDGASGQTMITDGAGTLSWAAPYGNRNLIINGAMQVAQRGTVTGVTSAYGGPDRFLMTSSGSVIFTLSQDTDVPTSQGFANSFKADVTTADSSLAASDYAILFHRFEGQNLQHLKKGTSSAESVTLSFWIKSSTTGTYILELFDNDNTRQISKSYTVDTADTWEKKELTFAGDTSGAFSNDNGLSMQVGWWLAAGSTYSSGTLSTSWTSSTNANRAVGQVNAIDDAANNIFITGVQLEVGTATPFEHRSYADELFACQRYYSHAVAATGPAASSTTAIQAFATFPRQMRASPSYSVSGALNWSNGYSADFVQSTGQVNVISNNTDGSPAQFLNFANFSGLTSGTIHFFPRNSTNNNRIIADAEL